MKPVARLLSILRLIRQKLNFSQISLKTAEIEPVKKYLNKINCFGDYTGLYKIFTAVNRNVEAISVQPFHCKQGVAESPDELPICGVSETLTLQATLLLSLSYRHSHLA